MIQLYAVIWMCINGFGLYMMRDSEAEEKGAAEKAEEIIEEIEFMEKFTSYEFSGKEFLIYFAVFLSMDIGGYYLAAGHVEFAPWTLWLFYAAVGFLAVDAVLDLYSLYEIIHTKDSKESKEKFAESLRSAGESLNWISFLSLGGKFLVSVALVLWTVFPR